VKGEHGAKIMKIEDKSRLKVMAPFLLPSYHLSPYLNG